MITGIPKRQLNEFEEELENILGDYQDNSGLSFYYYQLHDTFIRAENSLIKPAEEYMNSLKREDYEVRRSIIDFDPKFHLIGNPLLDTLRKSYFVTAHSEFESIWREIIEIHNQYYTPRDISSLNDKYLSHPNFNLNCLLDRVVKKHEILVTYNYIRNKLVHQKATTTTPDFVKLKQYIGNGEFTHLDIKEEGGIATFILKDRKFIRIYTHRILALIEDIVDTSFNMRTYGS